MARAMSSKTLESVTKLIQVDGLSLVQEEMRFGLADNEIGQMTMIDMEYLPEIAGADDGHTALGISLDPDSNLDPLTDDVEDLEYLAGLSTNGTDASIVGTCGKILEFKDKVNFGTNIGITARATATGQIGKYMVTIWFLRKKASSIELAKILLKRR